MLRSSLAVIPLSIVMVAAALVPAADAPALERLFGGSRDARDIHAWLAAEPRGTGVEAGGMLWRPTIPLGMRYDDNIFANDRRDHDDGVFSITPSLLGETSWGGHEFALSAYSRTDVGVEQSRQDHTEYGAGASAKVELLDWLDFRGRYRYDRLAEDWESPDIPLAAAERPELEQVSTRIGLHAHRGRLSSALEFMYLDVTYDDVAARGGGEINERFRNRDTVNVFVEFAYALSAQVQPYAQFIWNDHGYDDWPVDRDGAGKNAFGGVRFRLPNGIGGDVYAGYLFQNYGDDDPRLEEADGIGFGVDLDWRLSDATELRLQALREIEEATTDLESGRFTSTVRGTVERRLNDRLAVEGLFAYENSDYGGTPREEDGFGVGLALIGDISRNVYSRLAYRYDTRDSNAVGRSYDRNRILLTLGWKR